MTRLLAVVALRKTSVAHAISYVLLLSYVLSVRRRKSPRFGLWIDNEKREREKKAIIFVEPNGPRHFRRRPSFDFALSILIIATRSVRRATCVLPADRDQTGFHDTYFFLNFSQVFRISTAKTGENRNFDLPKHTVEIGFMFNRHIFLDKSNTGNRSYQNKTI